MPEVPALLVVAHGTKSAAGSATTAALAAAIAVARPRVPVSLCFLDVAAPRLADALDAESRPTVVLPLLLSVGYHVLQDVPAVVAGRPRLRIARHLGPDRLVVDALVDRLAEARGSATVTTTFLVGAGSRNPAAADDLACAAAQLAARLGRLVPVLTLGDNVRHELGRAAGPTEVATYLLAEGQFVDSLRAAAASAGVTIVADPIGVHPALIALALARYDEAVAAW